MTGRSGRAALLGGAALVLAATLVAGPSIGERPGAASDHIVGHTTADGVYSAAQAAEGATLYQGICASCHGESLMGSYEVPALTGRFVANWANGSVGTLFEYVSRAMPQMAPGSLSPDDNARIVAYLLHANGMPAGAKPLPSDPSSLNAIAFRPVPLRP